MEKKEFNALKRKELAQIRDPEVRSALFFPSPKELRSVSAMLAIGLCIIAGLFHLIAASYSEDAAAEALYIYDGGMYADCHNPSSRMVFNHEACKTLREGEESGAITNAQEFAAVWKERAYWMNMGWVGIPVLVFAGVVFAAGTICAFLKGRDPFMFTKTGEKIVVEHSGAELKSMEISGKRMATDLPGKRVHFLVRPIGRYTLVSFVTFGFRGPEILRVSSAFEAVLMDEGQREKFRAFLESCRNVKESKAVRHPKGKVMEFG